MRWFRRTRRANVGTFVEPEPVEPPPIDEQVDDGVLVALAAVRLAVTNRLILQSLRDGVDYDQDRVRVAVTAEILALAVEKQKDAGRIRRTLNKVFDRPGAASGPNDFRSRDAGQLERRTAVSERLAARLAILSTDPVTVGEVADRAYQAFLDEFEVSVAERINTLRAPELRPLTPTRRAAELRGLMADLEVLAADRDEAEQLSREAGD